MTPETFIGAIPMPAAQVSRDGKILIVNAVFESVFGTGRSGRHFATTFRQPGIVEALEKAVRTGEAGTGRYVGHQAAGRDTTYDVAITPVGEDGFLLVFEDRTHLAEAGERRSEFVANVSHELRTPLTAIAGFIETLRGPAHDDPEARDRFLEIMERETHRMNRLVDDLLSLSRVEDVERMRPLDDIDLAAQLREVAARLSPQAEARGVRLDLRGCDTALIIPGDRDQLGQVFTNLVENAIKYGREGGRVSVTLEESEDEPVLRGPGVKVTVEDEGEGIAAHHIARLTERFYRVDAHRSRGMGGTGLGLAIVKHIVNRHRGRLRIESEIGKGSRFMVFLPHNQ